MTGEKKRSSIEVLEFSRFVKSLTTALLV